MTKVLQCDREAAFKVLCRTDHAGGMGREYIRDSMDDGNFAVGAFARHREEAQAELLEALEAARDYVLDVSTGAFIFADGSDWIIPEMPHEDLAKIDAAIARAKGEGE